MLWVRILIRARCTTLCDKVCQWLATGRWFSPSPLVFSTNKADLYDITEILFKMALNTIKQTNIKHMHTFIYIFFLQKSSTTLRTFDRTVSNDLLYWSYLQLLVSIVSFLHKGYTIVCSHYLFLLLKESCGISLFVSLRVFPFTAHLAENHVSYCHHLVSIVIVWSHSIFNINILHFYLLHQNHEAN